MIDPKILKDNLEIIIEMLEKRNIDFPLKQLIDLDKKRRRLIIDIQKERHKKNRISNTIAQKKKKNEDTTLDVRNMIDIGKSIDVLETEMVENSTIFKTLMMSLPNLLHETVPVGKAETDNVVIRQYTPSKKVNSVAKDHIDIGNDLNLIEIERAAKISGARFYFLKNELVRLNHALVCFALDFLDSKGYTLLQPPYMIRKKAMEGAVILEDFRDVIYKIEDEDLFMIGTSEHAMAAMHMDEILEGSKLPIRYAGFSPCFRKEAGAHGKDMKGIFRVHHFDKVEQFVYARPENSWDEHEKMLNITEEFYEKLGIPFRIILLCSAEMGNISAKTYDIETWMPAQKNYREIVSCSNCVDYQARRLGIRFRDKTNEETRLVHTLNSTLVATQRTLVAILENYQTSDGLAIPDVLQDYIGGMKEIKPKFT